MHSGGEQGTTEWQERMTQGIGLGINNMGHKDKGEGLPGRVMLRVTGCDPQILLSASLCHSSGRWGTENLSNLLKHTQRGYGRAGIKPRQHDSGAIAFNH